ncbi:hypothetical protein F5Y06DRAFT_299038 [Hypoxylon sp. FL0890]|nr:hypothetical protein F5Y06DRAFT_299038 [Hypoxylon sp. FL0890]
MKPTHWSILVLCWAKDVFTLRFSSVPQVAEPPSITQVRHTTTILKHRDCANTGPNALAGSAGCLSLINRSATATDTAVESPKATPKTTSTTSATQVISYGAILGLVNVTATQRYQGILPTTVVTWLSTDLPVTTTDLNGLPTRTVVPVWKCTGDLCNPDCLVPVKKCRNQNGVGIDGFPWPNAPDAAVLIPSSTINPSQQKLTSTSTSASTSVVGGVVGGGDVGNSNDPSTTADPTKTAIATSKATTSTTTAESGMCGFGSCGCYTPPADKQAPSNTPGEKLPSITDFPSPDQHNLKRAPAPEDSNPILSNDFEDPGPADSLQRQSWYRNARLLDLAHPFITGGGPSWGCTTALVFSDRGIWIAHFWEADHIARDAATYESSVMGFIRNGGHNFPSLADARKQYFGNDPSDGTPARFVHALIFTPNSVNPRGNDVPTFDRTGHAPTDPWWFSRINRMKEVIKEVVPEVGDNVEAATYAWYGDKVVRNANNAELGIVVWEYVPRHVHRNDAGNQCANSRAIRVHVQGRYYGPWVWPWPVAPRTQPQAQPQAQPWRPWISKRAEVGICPANIADLLKNQDSRSKSTDADFYDPAGELAEEDASATGTSSSDHARPSSTTSVGYGSSTKQGPPPSKRVVPSTFVG